MCSDVSGRNRVLLACAVITPRNPLITPSKCLGAANHRAGWNHARTAASGAVADINAPRSRRRRQSSKRSHQYPCVRVGAKGLQRGNTCGRRQRELGAGFVEVVVIPLRTAENKQLILQDRAADIKTKLVVDELRRNGNALILQLHRYRGQRGAAIPFPARPVPLVRTVICIISFLQLHLSS